MTPQDCRASSLAARAARAARPRHVQGGSPTEPAAGCRHVNCHPSARATRRSRGARGAQTTFRADKRGSSARCAALLRPQAAPRHGRRRVAGPGAQTLPIDRRAARLDPRAAPAVSWACRCDGRCNEWHPSPPPTRRRRQRAGLPRPAAGARAPLRARNTDTPRWRSRYAWPALPACPPVSRPVGGGDRLLGPASPSKAPPTTVDVPAAVRRPRQAPLPRDAASWRCGRSARVVARQRGAVCPPAGAPGGLGGGTVP